MNRLTGLLIGVIVVLSACEEDPPAADDGGALIDSNPDDSSPDDSNVADATAAEDSNVVDSAAFDAELVRAAPMGLDAYPAHAAVGLDWDEVGGADSYVLYWSTEPGPTTTGTRIDDVSPGYVHRGLENGTTYHYIVTAVMGGAEGPASDEAQATPGGEFELHTLGTGRMENVAAGDTVELPIDRRIHVILLSEGYLEADLDTFASDVDTWAELVFALEPYSFTREAFVIWKVSRASEERVTPAGADTAFLVPITDDGRGVSSVVPRDGPTSTRVWSVVRAFPYGLDDVYPPGGLTNRVVKGVVPHILVYDAERGSSGLSGRARRFVDPDDPSRILSAAIAHGRTHEFTHALARAGDEYLGELTTGRGRPNDSTNVSSNIYNVVDDNDCDTVPWRHLLAGSEITPSADELVGAFGTPTRGYHSEFKCLMNGTSDNGVFFGGANNLRVSRFCNFCRELAAFRIQEHTGVLPDASTSWATWVENYRTPFYARHAFAVPDVVPQENSLGEARFQACAP